MDKVNTQAAVKVPSYETSRTRRSLVDGNIQSEDSNNVSDEEYASSGFYVREKSNDKKLDNSILSNSPKPIVNGENSNGAESNSKSDTLPEETTNGDDKTVNKDEAGNDNDEQANNDVIHTNNENDDQDKEKDREHSPNAAENIEASGQENNDDFQTNNKNDDKENERDEQLNAAENIQVPEQNTHSENEEPVRLPEEKEEETISQSGKENSPTNVSNDEPISEVTSQTSEHEEEHSVDKTNDKIIECETTDSSESTLKNDSKTVTSDETGPTEKKEECVEYEISSKDGAKGVEIESTTIAVEGEVLSETKENEDKNEKADGEDVSMEVDLVEKKDDQPESEKLEGSKTELKGVSAEAEAKPEESKAEDGSDKKTDTECSVDINSETKVGSDAEKNDLLGAVELTPRGDEPFDVDLTKDESSETSTRKKSPAKRSESILKSHLSGKASEGEGHEAEMEDDFDPSLFCPDISMDVDEAPVVTNENHIPDDGSTSPLLYQPIFSTLVDEITGAEVQVDLTPEEMEIRQKMYGPDNPVQKSKVHCTACNVHLGSAMSGANNRFVHPLLKVLICKNCYHFYTSGEFEKDEDGSELYCRWCGQGGQVLCCSSCEFVFCKRCIRNNFGAKKFKEIRNSDDWNCFRCDPGQLSNLRASCAEFMEYYRTELARAYSLSATNPELMTTDYTTCCSTPPLKKEETPAPVIPRPKRKRKDDDPDYSPMAVVGEPPAKKPVLTSGPGYTVISNPSMIVRPIAPRPMSATPIAPRPIAPQGVRAQLAQTFKLGNTIFRSKAPNYTVQRPNEGAKNSPGYITIPSSSVSKTTTPGYIKLVPSSRMSAPNRSTGTITPASGSTGLRPSFTPVRPTKPPPSMPTMKHEWFEKTVRAAARVNSNLSYTLTQLNRQQSQASNVESLAVVHNKLQEVLSTTINSLIQIRKNLRTEFISGIRNVKFPPKPAAVTPPPAPIVVRDDDDVIFVSQPSTTPATAQPPAPVVLSPSVTLSKAKPSIKLKPGSLVKLPSAAMTPLNPPKNSTPAAVTTVTPSTGRTTGFLKVRSFTALQNVTSECIIIPDDPPESSKPIEIDPEPSIPVEPQPVEPKITKVVSHSKEDSNSKKTFNVLMVHNVLKKPSPQIRNMMNAVVKLERCPEIEKLIEQQRRVSN